MKTYRGYRLMQRGIDGQPVSSKCVVVIYEDGKRKRPLRLFTSIRNHSPTGFEWGYGGSGPAQLALALVADCCGKKLAIPTIYQWVKASIVSRLPQDGWVLTEEQIRASVQAATEAHPDVSAL